MFSANRQSKQAVIVLNKTHLHFFPQTEMEPAVKRCIRATPFHVGTITLLLREELQQQQQSREPKWLLKISFPQMMHDSLSAVKLMQRLYGSCPVLGWEIRRHVCVRGSRGGGSYYEKYFRDSMWSVDGCNHLKMLQRCLTSQVNNVSLRRDLPLNSCLSSSDGICGVNL